MPQVFCFELKMSSVIRIYEVQVQVPQVQVQKKLRPRCSTLFNHLRLGNSTWYVCE